MEKLKMQTADGVQDNISRIAELFPECITEVKTQRGRIKRSVDFDKLRQLLSSDIVEGNEERYQFTWAHPTNPVECCADANPKTMLPNDT